MRYEDLKLKELVKTKTQWYGVFVSAKGDFKFPVADACLSEQELKNHRLVVGSMFLGAIEDERLVGLDGFSYIEDTPTM